MEFDAQVTATPSSLVLARTARGWTQNDLAARTGISQAFLSKAEKGAVELAGQRLLQVATALGYPVEYFATDPGAEPAATACAFPRKRNSLPTSAEKRIRALLQLTRMQVELLVDEKTPIPSVPRRSPEDADWIDAVEVAEQIRVQAGLPRGPIPNMVEFVERLGVIVVVRDLGTRRLDAIGQWPIGHRPLMLVNSTASPDRVRFTLGHEFGHFALHTVPRANQEDEADRFSAALLMPGADAREVFTGEVDLALLAELKPIWGMSMAALARRAWTAGRISDYRYRQLNIELSAAGYRLTEPVQLRRERPSLVPAALSRRLATGDNTTSLAHRARMNPDEFSSLYLEDAV